MSYPLFVARVSVVDYVKCALQFYKFAGIWNSGVFKNLRNMVLNQTTTSMHVPSGWTSIPFNVPGTGITGISIKWKVHRFASIQELRTAWDNGVFRNAHVPGNDITTVASARNGKYLIAEWHEAKFLTPDGQKCPCRTMYEEAVGAM